MTRWGVALAALFVSGQATPESFDTDAFDSNAFSASAFDLGAGGSSVAVPDVLGLSAAAADTALEAEGLDTGATTNVCSAVSVGNVVSQAPPAGALVSAGTLVNLSLSTGVACKGTGGKLRLRLDLRL